MQPSPQSRMGSACSDGCHSCEKSQQEVGGAYVHMRVTHRAGRQGSGTLLKLSVVLDGTQGSYCKQQY